MLQLSLRTQSVLSSIVKFGIHSKPYMSAAGFKYVGDGDKARCNDCQLEVSNWTENMIPFTVHSEIRPDCPFVCSMKVSSSLNVPFSHPFATPTIQNPAENTEEENPAKRRKIEPQTQELCPTTLLETNSFQQVRRRTFSHWSHRTIASSAEMIEAGFFNCNVGDRVICIYCNLICHQWIAHDDPCEVHKNVSPRCIYVIAKLKRPVTSRAIAVNGNTSQTSDGDTSKASNLDLSKSNNFVVENSWNLAYSEIPKRYASYDTWSNEDSPPVNHLVKAGFYYSGTKTIVTCFYCNGSLQDLDANDNPLIEHARRFPHCAYARQECGEELYRKIQESKRAQQECAITNDSTVSQKLVIPDESTLSRLVAARLDLSVSQRLLDQNFKLSVIKRCWEDQLRIKRDDFVSECDLHTACVILQKQIEHIDVRKENIVIPNIKMKEIREQNVIGMLQASGIESNISVLVSDLTDSGMVTSS